MTAQCAEPDVIIPTVVDPGLDFPGDHFHEILTQIVYSLRPKKISQLYNTDPEAKLVQLTFINTSSPDFG